MLAQISDAASSVTPVTQAVTFGIIASFFALITIVYQTVAKRTDKRLADEADQVKEDRHEARLKEVEEQAAIVAKLLAESNERVAAGRHEQLAMLTSLEAHQENIERSQDIMHAMLNSAQTTQMLALVVTLKNSRASLRVQYSQMKELAFLRSTGKTLTQEQETALGALQDQIEQLGADITANQDAVDDRVRAQELAESRERNKTKDNMANEVTKMVPASSPLSDAPAISGADSKKDPA